MDLDEMRAGNMIGQRWFWGDVYPKRRKIVDMEEEDI